MKTATDSSVYFPKNRDFKTITQEEISQTMDKLNNRPGKCLGIKTPEQSAISFNLKRILVFDPPDFAFS